MALGLPQDSANLERRPQSLQEYAASLAAREELLELTHDAIIVRDIAGEIVFWNRGAEELYGWSRYDARGKTTAQVLQTEFPEPLEHIIEHVKRNGRWDGELVHTRRDGARVIVSSRWTMQFRADGMPLGILEMNDDITERRAADLALRTSQARFAGIINSAMDAIVSIDENQSIIIFNAAAEKMFGWAAAEILGKPLITLIPPALRQVHTQHVIQFGQTGVSTRAMGQLGELRGLRRDGSEFPIEASISQIEAGGSKIFTVILRDSTQRKQHEQRLQYFADLIENVSDAIISTDDKFNVASWNHAAEVIYGWRAEQVMGAPLDGFVQTDFLGADRAQVVKTVLETGAWHGEVKQRRQDGSFIDIQAATVVLKDAQGKILGAVSVNRDVTARKRAEAAEHMQRIFAQALADTALALNSTLDFNTVLDLILENANRVVPHDASTIMLIEAGATRVVRSRGYTADQIESILALRFPVEETFNLRTIAESGQPLRIEDVNHYAGWQRTAGVDQQRAWLGAPIRNQGQVIGFISLDSFTPNAFSETDAAHLQAFADQASIAVTNARLLNEAQARADQFAQLYEMAQDLSQQNDLPALEQMVVTCAARLLGVTSGTLSLYDAQRNELELVVAHNFAAPPGMRFQMGEGPSGHVAATREPLILDEKSIPNFQILRPAGDAIRGAIMMPLLTGGELMGVLGVGDTQNPGRKFDAADVKLLSLLAGPAAGAIYNAQLLARLEKQLSELQAVNRISTALRAAQSLDDMLPLLLHETISIFGADAGSIWLYDTPRDELNLAAQQGWGDTPITSVKSRDTLPGYVLTTGVPYIRQDVRTDPLISETVRNALAPGTSAAAVPIRAAAQVIGVMFLVDSGGRSLTEEQVRLFTTIAEFAGTAIQRTGLLEQTQQQLERLSALRAIDMAISASVDVRLALNVVLEQTLAKLRVDAAAVLLLNPHTNFLEYAAGRGFRSRELERSSLRLGEGYAGRAALERKLVHVPNLATTQPVFRRATLVALENFVTYYAVPLVVKGMVKGVLEIYHRALLAPDDAWLTFLEALAGQAAIAVDNAELFGKLQRSNLELMLAYDTTLEGWSRALDLRDKETEGHTERVTELTMQLARAMNVPDAELVHIRRGSLLHDIGKMGIPDSILLKPGPLTDAEWEIMRQHPVYAYELLSQVDHLKPALTIPYAHHEKWDGTGYPRGLKAEQIPFAARIFAIVDVYDALSSDRPYRKAWDKERVRAHIQSLSGTHFEPAVVEAFLALDLP